MEKGTRRIMSGQEVTAGHGTGLTVPSGARSAVLARNWWAIALRGALGILFGVIAFVMPEVTISVLIFWFAIYMLVDGMLAIMAGVRAAARHERWATLILEGAANLIAGAIALVWPIVTLLVFVWLSGGWAIVSGVLMLSAAFRLDAAHGRWLLALGGAASVLWGMMLLIAPVPGAVIMTWWLGAYALMFGVVLLSLGFRLRRGVGTGAEAKP